MFEKIVLDQDGEIPQVFRTGLLKADTGSELSRLMSDIEKNHPSEFEQDGNNGEERKREDGETSLDSQMEDTPANYNQANQRYDDNEQNNTIPEDEEGGEHFGADVSEYEDAGS